MSRVPVLDPATGQIHDPLFGFHVSLPEGWLLVEDKISRVMAESPERSANGDRPEAKLQVVASRMEAPGLAEYVERSLKTYRKMWKLVQRHDEEGRVTLELTQDIVHKMHLLKRFELHGDRVYVVTVSAMPSRFAQNRRRLEAILDSFKVEARIS